MRRYTKYSWFINLSGHACSVSNLAGTKNAHQDGAIVLYGFDNTVTNCAMSDGCRHSMLVGWGSAVQGTSLPARPQRHDETNANQVVFYSPNGSGRGATVKNCAFDGGGQPAVEAIDGHDSVPTSLFSGFSISGGTAANLIEFTSRCRARQD